MIQPIHITNTSNQIEGRTKTSNRKKNYQANSTTPNHFAKRNQSAMSINSAAEAARNSGDYDNEEAMAGSRSAELLAAASEGRGHEVVRILEADPEMLRVGDPVGDTALHVLARAGHVDALRQLIRFLRSKPNYKELLSTVAKQGNGHGDTPLHLASKNRQREAVILLYKAESRAGFMDNDDAKSFWDLTHEFGDDYEWDGDTQLMPRLTGGAITVEMEMELGRKELMMSGFDPKLIQTKSKETGNTIFQDAYQVNNNGESPLSLALMRGQDDLVKYVLQVMPEASISPATRHALVTPHKGSLPHTAIRARNLTMLQMILESIPCLIDSSDEKGWKPLSYAAYKGYLEEVRYLLNRFPESIKRFDGDGSLPIHKAVSGGHISVIKEFILSHPQSLYAIDKKGRSVLHIAVRYAKADILKCLIHETDGIQKIYDLRDHDGKTFEDYAKELKRN